MRTDVLVLSFCISTFATSASAQSSLPRGYYEINGTVTSISGSACPLARTRPVSGHIYYPGVGHATTQLVLESVDLGRSVTVAFMFAFPPVPADGLNGWSGANAVSPNYNQYQNGKLTGGGSAAILGFNLAYTPMTMLTFAQGTLAIQVDSIAPCAETVQGLFTRVAPFEDSK